MPRPNNFWDVLAQTADYASQAIPAAQRENRQIAQERERFGLRAQQERDQFNETRRYHDAQIGLQGARMNAQQHPTSHPSFDQVYADILLHPENYDPQVVKDFKEANSERHPGRAEPQPKEWQQPPNFIGDISSAADKAVAQNAILRKNEGTTTVITDANGNPTYAPPTTPALPRSQALENEYNLRAGQFPRYNVKPDSIRAGLGLRTNATGLRPGAPSSNIGDLRRMDRPQTVGNEVDLSTLSDEELDALERQITGQ